MRFKEQFFPKKKELSVEEIEAEQAKIAADISNLEEQDKGLREKLTDLENREAELKKREDDLRKRAEALEKIIAEEKKQEAELQKELIKKQNTKKEESLEPPVIKKSIDIAKVEEKNDKNEKIIPVPNEKLQKRLTKNRWRTLAAAAGLGIAGLLANQTIKKSFGHGSEKVQGIEKIKVPEWKYNVGVLGEYVDKKFKTKLNQIGAYAGFEQNLHRAKGLENGEIFGNNVVIDLQNKKIYFINSENELKDQAQLTPNQPTNGMDTLKEGDYLINDATEIDKTLANIGVEIPEKFKKYLEPLVIKLMSDERRMDTTVIPSELTILPAVPQKDSNSIAIFDRENIDSSNHIPVKYVKKQDYEDKIHNYELIGKNPSQYTCFKYSIIPNEGARLDKDGKHGVGKYWQVNPSSGAIGLFQFIESYHFPNIGLKQHTEKDESFFKNSPATQHLLFRILNNSLMKEYPGTDAMSVKCRFANYAHGHEGVTALKANDYSLDDGNTSTVAYVNQAYARFKAYYFDHVPLPEYRWEYSQPKAAQKNKVKDNVGKADSMEFAQTSGSQESYRVISIESGKDVNKN